MQYGEILRFIIDSGMININDVQNSMETMKRNELLENHPYKIWKGKDGSWYTYLPKEGDGRRQVKRKEEKEIQNVVIEYWKSQNKENFTFKTRYFIWVDRQKACGRAAQTISKYKADYVRFFEKYPISNMDIRKISEEIIFEHFKKVAIEKKIPYKAVKEAFGYVRGVFKKSIMDKVVKPEDDPCIYVDVQLLKKHCTEKVKTTKERTLSDYERHILLDKIHNPRSNNANPVVNFAIELSLYTGMRVGELSALRWCNIDEENNCIVIREAEVYDPINKEYSISTTKNDKIRFFPITEEIKDIFSKIKAYELKNGFYGEYVFQDSKGRVHARRISESVRNKTMSSEFVNTKSIHAIRRTLNSNLRCNGVSATVAASLLGHTQKVNETNYTYDVVGMEEKTEIIKKAGFIS